MCQYECRSSTGCVESTDVEDTVVVAVVSKAEVVECTVSQLDRFKNSLGVDTEPCTGTCIECRVDELDAVYSCASTEVEAVTTVACNIIDLYTVIPDRTYLRALRVLIKHTAEVVVELTVNHCDALNCSSSIESKVMRIVSNACTVECEGLEVYAGNVCTDLKTTLDCRLSTLRCSVTIDSYRTAENNASDNVRSL